MSEQGQCKSVAGGRVAESCVAGTSSSRAHDSQTVSQSMTMSRCTLLLHFPAQLQRASTLVTQSPVNHHLRMGTLFVLIRDGNYYRLTLITNVISVCS